MNTKQQLLKSIQETEEQLSRLKEQLNKKHQPFKKPSLVIPLKTVQLLLKKKTVLPWWLHPNQRKLIVSGPKSSQKSLIDLRKKGLISLNGLSLQ